MVGAVSDTCDLINFTYTVSFEVGGGAGPYTLTSGPSGSFAGNIFTSDPIPSGTAYAFEFFDANGCGPLLVEGQVTCECATDAGTMAAGLVEACADETAIADLSIGAVLDPEDILLYVVHNGTGPALGTEVYGYNSLPEFALIPPMQTGVTYYISAIAGNDFDLDGTIDTNDPCVSVAAGTPVLFHSLPEVSFVADATVCEGETATLTLSVQAESCVDITYTVSDGSSGSLTCVGDGDQIQVPAGTDNLVVDITGVTDLNGCTSLQFAQANIQVNLEPTATLEPTASVCNSTDSGMSTELNFDDFLLAGDLSGTWANTSGAAITGSFPTVNFDGATPGSYVFTYTTASALPPCSEQSFTMTVEVEDCVCPSLELSPAPPLCNNNGTVDLTNFEITSAPGIWSISGMPAGSNPATLNGTDFDAAGADPGTYELTFTLVNAPPVGCPTFNTLEVVVSEYLTAGVAGAEAEFCESSVQVVSLADLLIDADAGGAWAETSLVPSTPGAFNAGAGTFNTAGQTAASYTFSYTLDPDAPCPSEQTEVTVVVHPLPAVDAGDPGVLTCFEPEYTLNATADQGGFFQYSWSADDGSFPGDSTQLNPIINEAGVYTLTVTNTATGCMRSDQVVVTANQEVPVPFISISPVSCFGFDDGYIVVDSVVGGQPPYVYSLNGEPFSGSGFYPNLEASTYTLVVEDANGCANEPLIIDITQPQELNVELVAIIEGGGNVIRLGDSIELAALVNVPDSQIDSISWSPPLILSCDTCLNPTAYPLETTTFSVMVESNGCTDADALQIIVDKNRAVYVPNGFSPNGDGTNDIFYINAGPQVRRIRSFLVFNRWGETVFQYYQFEPNNPAYGWDGTFRGKLMDPAVFTWFAEIEFIDDRVEVFKGDVTLVK
ncbi:MAG: gliding motility-associated C-terminal domain-containing protein [Phaeodactylibacter sp.]|nr:gliding motility-associated C-terminal domain-containing protein [Phaeodactylibacter sp.]